MSDKEYIWCIAYINRVFMETIIKDLVNSGFGDVKVNIPTVRVLKKKFKGKEFYEEVPLLFNYGFFRLPIEGAMNKDYLMRMKAAVQGIYSWLYRSAGALPATFEDVHTQSLTSVASGEELEIETKRLVSPILVHTIRMKEIALLKRVALVSSIYSSDDVSALKEGTYIVLKGYPFDNIPAEVVSVHPTKEEVRVKLLVEGNIGEAKVSFSNIFYSIYADPDEPTPSDQTVEGIMSKYQVRSDKIFGDNE
jgi:transcription antitermination factor NusG